MTGTESPGPAWTSQAKPLLVVLRPSIRTYLRRNSWWVLLPIAAPYLRGGVFFQIFSAVCVAIVGVLWIALFPRRLVLDDWGFSIKHILWPTKHVRWADVQRFQLYPRSVGLDYAGWYLVKRTGSWWKRGGPDGGVLAVFPGPEGGDALTPSGLTVLLNSWVRAHGGAVASDAPRLEEFARRTARRELRRQTAADPDTPPAATGERDADPAADRSFAEGLADMIVSRRDGVSVAEAEEILAMSEDVLVRGGVDPEDVLRRLHERAAGELRESRGDDDPFRTGRL
jgi:hypothetical protein